jgi:hypothetical protein
MLRQYTRRPVGDKFDSNTNIGICHEIKGKQRVFVIKPNILATVLINVIRAKLFHWWNERVEIYHTCSVAAFAIMSVPSMNMTRTQCCE